MTTSTLSHTQFGESARAMVLAGIHDGLAKRLSQGNPQEDQLLRGSMARNEHAWNETMHVHAPEFVESIH